MRVFASLPASGWERPCKALPCVFPGKMLLASDPLEAEPPTKVPRQSLGTRCRKVMSNAG